MYKMDKDLPTKECIDVDRDGDDVFMNVHAYKEGDVICISPELFDIIQEEIRFAIKRENQSLFEFGD